MSSLLYCSSRLATPSSPTQLSGSRERTLGFFTLDPHPPRRRIELVQSIFVLDADDLGVPGGGRRYFEAGDAAGGSLEKLNER